ncbi:hypothetical protein MRB53_019670 [Persea americana]|uniref:Uncharacterized protein n=1 Tax=Persea americana TaxID=3435 RepID=A0ACC2KZE8_PERAE|nr:hypothetical protein MRB53_019670 [Persea americana]
MIFLCIEEEEDAMSFRFQNLLGAPYRGRNILVVDNYLLLSLVRNRIFATDLAKSQTQTLPYKASSNISRIAISPDVIFLIAVDDSSCALFINLHHHIVLHRISFKPPVSNSALPPTAPSLPSTSLESSSRSSNPSPSAVNFSPSTSFTPPPTSTLQLPPST